MRGRDPVKIVSAARIYGDDPFRVKKSSLALSLAILAHFKEIRLSLVRSQASLCAGVNVAVDFDFLMATLLNIRSNKLDKLHSATAIMYVLAKRKPISDLENTMNIHCF
jgi:hypothetical protein